MTCFWDGILRGIPLDNFRKIDNNVQQLNPTSLVIFLKRHNRMTSILWQGSKLTERERYENYMHIKNFDVRSISSGYLCSTCDPFLCLISDLFNINIDHIYLSSVIKYTNPNASKKVVFKSNRGHFWV